MFTLSIFFQNKSLKVKLTHMVLETKKYGLLKFENHKWRVAGIVHSPTLGIKSVLILGVKG